MAMQIGDLIRMKREEHGLTQEQLAELIGKSAGYIGQLERGLSMASIPCLLYTSGLQSRCFHLKKYIAAHHIQQLERLHSLWYIQLLPAQ